MANTKPVLLLLDDEQDFLEALSDELSDEYEVSCVRSVAEATAAVTSSLPDVALLDVQLDRDDTNNREGVTALQMVRASAPNVPVLMLSRQEQAATIDQCMQHGAADFIEKSTLKPPELKLRIRLALENARIRREYEEIRSRLHLTEPREMVGKSAALLEVKSQIKQVAANGDVTVLLLGETGTGKELVARAIHASGHRSTHPIVTANIREFSDELVGSELFGHERGAFTGAVARHIGYIERAHRGVLFLDEIGELELKMQTKLLRVVQEREFHRLGGTNPIRVDVQIVTATNADLESMVKEGRFREDLYARLNVFKIAIPPLRERMEDLPLLIDHFLGVHRKRGYRLLGVSSDALSILQRYPWPRNVRELQNAIESAVIRAPADHRMIEMSDLPSEICSGYRMGAEGIGRRRSVGDPGFSLEEARAHTELFYIDQALSLADRKGQSGELLGFGNRYRLSRTVARIFRKYPDLANEFPRVKAAFTDSEAAGA